MITKEQHSRWLEALRSGAFPQGQYGLKDKNGNFCCLGVLANVINPNAWNDTERWYAWAGERFSLPEFILPAAVQAELVQLNNPKLKNFLEIADWIETNITPIQDTE